MGIDLMKSQYKQIICFSVSSQVYRKAKLFSPTFENPLERTQKNKYQDLPLIILTSSPVLVLFDFSLLSWQMTCLDE